MSYDFGLQHLCQKWRLLFGTKKQNTDWMKKLPQMWMTWGLSFARLQEGQSQQRQVFARLETCMIYINKNTDLGETKKYILNGFILFLIAFLRFFDPKAKTTLQCDASEFGFGGCLMSEGQPFRYICIQISHRDREKLCTTAIDRPPVSVKCTTSRCGPHWTNAGEGHASSHYSSCTVE